MDRVSGLFSTAYFPSICYLQSYFRHTDCTIEAFESFPKQTQRNRCEIFTSNGLLRLSVPVSKINGSKTLTKDIDIDFSKKWQNEHWRAIQSAYAAAPYFEDYQAYVKDIIYNSPTKLIDLNLERANAKRRSYDFRVGGQVLIKADKPKKLDARAHGPYRITQVYTNGTCDVERRPGVTERMNIWRLVPYFRPTQQQRRLESVVENVEAAPVPQPNETQQNGTTEHSKSASLSPMEKSAT